MREEMISKVFFVLLALTLLVAIVGTFYLQNRKLDILEVQGCASVITYDIGG